MHRIPCYLCGQPDSDNTPFFYQYRGKRIQIIRCGSCGLGSIDPMLSEAEVRGLYDDEYFERDFRCGLAERSYRDEIENIRREAKPHLIVLREYAVGRRYLEIGCAGGAMLAEAREQGFDTVGVEISKAMADWGRERLQLDIRAGTLHEQNFTNGQFDVVFLGDVIEHLLHPRQVMEEIHRILAPRGIVALAYPMELNGIIPRIRSFFNIERISPEKPYHLYYYTRKPMSKLLEQTGFNVAYAREEKIIRTQSVRMFLTDSLNKGITVLTGQAGDRGFTVGLKRPIQTGESL